MLLCVWVFRRIIKNRIKNLNVKTRRNIFSEDGFVQNLKEIIQSQEISENKLKILYVFMFLIC